VIITIASAKGGSGKTTLVTLLAHALAVAGQKVTVIDSDPVKTYADWHQHNYENGSLVSCVAETDNVKIVGAAYAASDRSDVVLIDTAGTASLTAAAAMTAADIVLVTVMPDRGAVREAMRAVEQVASIGKASRRTMDVRLVRSQWSENGLAERAAMADIAGMPMLRAIIPPIAAYRQATFTGYVPQSSRARAVSDALITELFPRKKGKR
jgi:chromosome partitioning protein